MPKLRLVLLGLLLLCGTLLARAQDWQERITRFHSDITVNADASLSVVDIITVHAGDDDIQRLFNDCFRAYYLDHMSKQFRVKSSVVREHDEAPGTYTYTLVYTTNHQRQFGSLKDHDELHWNVTGNNWGRPIEKVFATIHLPDNFSKEEITLHGSTPSQDSQAKNYRTWIDDSGLIYFSTTRPLSPQESFTIAIGFQKGIVATPALADRASDVLQKYPLLVGIVCVLLVLGYYLFAWMKVGRDPGQGVIIPRWEISEHLSPSTLRYLRRYGKFDTKTFTAAVMSLAIHGCLRITEDGGTCTLTREPNADTTNLHPDEEALFDRLFRYNTSLSLTGNNQIIMQRSAETLENVIRDRCAPKFLAANTRYRTRGIILLSVLLPLAIVCTQNSDIISDHEKGIFFAGILMIVVPLLVTCQAVPYLFQIYRRGDLYFWLTILLANFALMASAGIYLLSSVLPITLLLCFLLTFVINALFTHLLKAYTKPGRKLLDEIEGFRLYLSVAEKERLSLMNPQGQIPTHFERFLPYALALDIEQQWAEQFSDVLSSASASGDYRQNWYSGGAGSATGVSAFASSVGNTLTSSIASASSLSSAGSNSGGENSSEPLVAGNRK